MARKHRLDVATKEKGGVRGLSEHTRSGVESHGGFVGSDALRGGAAREVEMVEWEFLTAGREWDRQEMRRYVQGWLNENKFLRGPFDLPAFSQMVSGCLLIQRYTIRADKLKDPDAALALGAKIMPLWESVHKAMARMDAKEAQRRLEVVDENEEALRRFE